MQKDFKIGLAIGVILAAATVIWLSTLPNLSTRVRAIQAASHIKPSPETPPYVSPSQPPPDSESRNTNYELPTTNYEQQTMNIEPFQKIHIVQKGDTLSSISAKYYGSSKKWRKIVAANRDTLPDPNRLIPGVKLIIPQ
jgi:nucleoid-associated protein YgaU